MEFDEQTKANIEACFRQMATSFNDTELERQRPHVLMRPTLTLDGDHWIALYGENLQEGVAGCGKSPDEAMGQFDVAWYKRMAEPSNESSSATGGGARCGKAN